MKIWRVKCNYDSGDHEKGYYESPLFVRQEDAEKFLEDLNGGWDDKWAHNSAGLEAVDVLEGPCEVKDPNIWLNIVFT